MIFISEFTLKFQNSDFFPSIFDFLFAQNYDFFSHISDLLLRNLTFFFSEFNSKILREEVRTHFFPPVVRILFRITIITMTSMKYCDQT